MRKDKKDVYIFTKSGCRRCNKNQKPFVHGSQCTFLHGERRQENVAHGRKQHGSLNGRQRAPQLGGSSRQSRWPSEHGLDQSTDFTASRKAKATPHFSALALDENAPSRQAIKHSSSRSIFQRQAKRSMKKYFYDSDQQKLSSHLYQQYFSPPEKSCSITTQRPYPFMTRGHDFPTEPVP